MQVEIEVKLGAMALDCVLRRCDLVVLHHRSGRTRLAYGAKVLEVGDDGDLFVFAVNASGGHTPFCKVENLARIEIREGVL
jgi:hypothetical protein